MPYDRSTGLNWLACCSGSVRGMDGLAKTAIVRVLQEPAPVVGVYRRHYFHIDEHAEIFGEAISRLSPFEVAEHLLARRTICSRAWLASCEKGNNASRVCPLSVDSREQPQCRLLAPFTLRSQLLGLPYSES